MIHCPHKVLTSIRLHFISSHSTLQGGWKQFPSLDLWAEMWKLGITLQFGCPLLQFPNSPCDSRGAAKILLSITCCLPVKAISAAHHTHAPSSAFMQLWHNPFGPHINLSVSPWQQDETNRRSNNKIMCSSVTWGHLSFISDFREK